MTLFRSKAIWIASMACTLLSVGGCVSSDVSDLDYYIEGVLAKPGGRIEPLPEIKPYEAYAYQSAAQDARDPFKLFYQKDEEALVDDQDSGLTKEMEDEIRHRNKEELEQFELDSLRMVGTMENDQNFYNSKVSTLMIFELRGWTFRFTRGPSSDLSLFSQCVSFDARPLDGRSDTFPRT